MPMYRFAVGDPHRRDFSDAIELTNDIVAVADAHRALAELVEDLPKGAHAAWRVAVEDASGTVIYQATLTFRGETAADMKARCPSDESKP